MAELVCDLVGALTPDADAPASCTQLACGANCVVAVGLCGRLRAWRRQASEHVADAAAAPGWELVLDESSSYELANNRRSSHPYRYLSGIAPDGRFAVATTVSAGTVEVWCSLSWQRLQLVDPAESEEERAEWVARGVMSIRAELSCLALAHDHLACGSREGQVRLWRADRKAASGGGGSGGELKRRFGRLVGDTGPLAAVVLTPSIVLAVYRASSGLVDGNAYDSGQSVCAWALESGALIWKHAPKLSAPALGAVRLPSAGMLVLYGPTGPEVDPDWNVLLGPSRPSSSNAESAAKAAVLLRSTPLGGDAAAGAGGGSGDGGTWHALRRGVGGGGSGRLLAWHALADESDREDGGMLALGFACGDVSLLAATESKPPFVVATASAGRADVAAVHVLPASLLAANADAVAGAMLAADASGYVRLWAMSRAVGKPAAGRLGSTARLICLRALTPAPSRQPTCLGIVGSDTLVCGFSDGRVSAMPLPLPLSEAAQSGAPAMDALTIDVGDVGVEVRDYAVNYTEDEHTAAHEYNWCFDSGAGPQGRGTLRERRRAFDGWAKTVAFEAGLQQVLAKMNSSQGTHSTGSPSAAAGSGGAGGGGGVSHLQSGMHVNLVGLAARPELNGSVGVLLGTVESESGRAPLRLVAPPEHEGKTMKVKPSNMRMLT